MRWFAAHIIMYYEYRDDLSSDQFFAYENIVIFRCVSPEEALGKARLRGQTDESMVDESLTRDGRPAREIFGGVRKVVECDEEEGPNEVRDGTEVTYLELSISGRDELQKLISGEDVTLVYH